MPKQIKEFQLNQSTGEVSVEYSDDSTSKFNAADMVTAQTDPVTGGISILAAGQSAPFYQKFRAPKSPYVFGNAAIIDRMQSDTELWNLWCYGDSRSNGIITQKYVALAPAGIPLGGVQLVSISLTPPSQNGTNCFVSSSVSSSAGDAIPTSPYVGYVADNITQMEFKTVQNGITYNGNTLQNRLSGSVYTGWDFSTATTLNARLNARQVRARALIRRTSNGWSMSLTSPLNASPTMPNIYLQVRQNGSSNSADPGYYKSNALPIYSADSAEYAVGGVTIPAGTNWTTYSNPDIGYVCDPNITMGVDAKVVSASSPWLELPTGILMRELGCVAGRSIAALLNEEATPQATFTKAMKACGGQHALWIAIGTNNPRSQTTAQFQSDLTSFIEKFREGAPGAPVIMITSYAASADGGVAPYYVQAIKNIAAIDANAVVIDTYNALPNYATGNALGYYGDTVHYNATGQGALVAKYWELWKAA